MVKTMPVNAGDEGLIPAREDPNRQEQLNSSTTTAEPMRCNY